MLDEQAVRRHVVAVDDDASVGSVAVPAHTVAVVRPPCPDVVEDDVVAVHDQADRRATRLCAADTEEHIVKSRRVGGSIMSLRAWPLPTCSSTGEFVVPASKIIPEINIPFALATVIDTIPFSGIRRRETETEHHGYRDA